jgi:AraC-like DNA-binding protein
MPVTASARHRAEYERRINRVVDYVSRNLDEALSLEKLAHVAAFSPFHFHRVFKAHTGFHRAAINPTIAQAMNDIEWIFSLRDLCAGEAAIANPFAPESVGKHGGETAP